MFLNDDSIAFAQIKLVCEKCYFEMKKLNLDYNYKKNNSI